jgi:hypothetical protein
MARNDVNLLSEPNLHKHTTPILLDESLFHVVKNAPHEYGGRIIILGHPLQMHPLLENVIKTQVKTLKEICGRRWERDNFNSVAVSSFTASS